MAIQAIQEFRSTNDIPSYPATSGIGVVGGQPWMRNQSRGLFPLGDTYPGKTYWVDANDGNNSNNGLSIYSPFLTMAKAFSVIVSGDTILFRGKIREQITAPVQVFDITIVGLGNRPRHADSTPNGGQDATNTWAAPLAPTGVTPLCKVLQQGWRFVNILFVGPTDAACVMLYRDNGAGDAERDASHAEFWNCRFASGQDGIEQSGGAGHVGIYDCFFTTLTGVAIKHTTGAGAGFPIRYDIRNNRFNSCPSVMTAVAAFDYRIQENSFAFEAGATLVFDFTGGARNVVVRNDFNIAAADFDPAGGVTGSGVTDVWSNTLTDAIETGLPAN